jgi:hypothetical protein
MELIMSMFSFFTPIATAPPFSLNIKPYLSEEEEKKRETYHSLIFIEKAFFYK